MRDLAHWSETRTRLSGAQAGPEIRLFTFPAADELVAAEGRVGLV